MPAAAIRSPWLASLLAASLLSSARAAESTRLSVWIEPQDVFSRRAASLMSWLLLQRLSEPPHQQAVDAACLFDPAPARHPLEPARAKLAQGMAAYENLELDRAERQLFEAVQAFEAEPAELIGDAARDHQKALAYLGAVWLLLGQSDKARDAFRRLLVLEPAYRLDERIFPPAMLETFARTLREVEESAHGALEVTAQPDAALVFVDGRFRGLAPLRLSRLPAGDHLVAVRAPGHAPFGRQVSVGGGEDASQACRLRPLPELADFQREFPSDRLGGGEPLPRPLLERARRAGLDRLVLGSTSRSGSDISFWLGWYDVASGELLRESRGRIAVDAADPDRATTRAVAELSLESVLVVDSAPPDSPSGAGALRLTGEERFLEKETPLVRRWWFWTALGAGAALTTLLAILLARGQDEARSQILIEF